MMDGYVRSFDKVLSPLGHRLVALSATNTQSLLSKASEFTYSHHTDAQVLLDRLRQLNPAVGAQFRLKDDVLSALRLRLITTTARPQASRQDVSSFIIISYCWHYPEWPLAPAAKPVAPGWEVSQAMVDATMALREHAAGGEEADEEGVWLDKVCINQSDDSEKQVHIGAMDIIYRSARRVIILLEDVQLTEAEQAAGLAYAVFYEAMCKKVREENLEDAAKAAFVESYIPEQEDLAPDKAALTRDIRLFVMRMLGARWLQRAWCAHESRVTAHPKQNNPLLLCYSHDGRVLNFEFRCVNYIASYLDKQEELKQELQQLQLQSSEPEIGRGDTTDVPNLRQQISLIERISPDIHIQRSAIHHIYSILASGCLRKEDLISIALNTSNTPLVFTGRLETTEEAAWIFTLVVLASGDLVPLLMNGKRLRLPHPQPQDKGVTVTATGSDRLSWLALPAHTVQFKTSQMLLPDSITVVMGEYIELDLMVFTCLPCKPSQEATDTARQIFKEHHLFDLIQDASKRVRMDIELLTNLAVRMRGDDDILKSSLITWLGHAIDCGLVWTAGFPDRIMQETQQGEWIYGTIGQYADARLSKAAESLFVHLSQKRVTAAAAVVESDSQTNAALVHNLTRFLSCILDPRFTQIAVTGPRRLSWGTDGDDNPVFTPSTSNRSWIAVPAALAHLPLWQSRAWIIEPFDPVNDAPEDPKSYLPYLDADGNGITRIRFPVVSSDGQDRRSGRLPEGTWKLRRQVPIMGSVPLVKAMDSHSQQRVGERVLLLKKQRVYGAEDYDWSAISAVANELTADLYGP
ncbi:hypothetical protein S40285_08170 [Stachybotrys chlorohalonatus IBT 40285]|uniref:Heterokaryon incompatibility domain-containing protein n=1 Tax=Stachybotrys chlorohalonatus (strain IBT 40285) TaxID=1283841 RepID=A0A084R1S9_STAC4|nr:hypothetical protein S40285_08170 [Stachybotrys chlorohalonata IBT 40285]